MDFSGFSSVMIRPPGTKVLLSMAGLWLAFCMAAPAWANKTGPDLLRQLGARDFASRVAAERELLEQGDQWIDLLEKGSQSPDPEIRQRSIRILGQLRRTAFARQRELIRENPWVASAELAPGWELFHSMAGDHAEARNLYVRIVEEEGELLQSLVQNPDRWTIDFERRCADIRAFGERRLNREISPLTVLALLMLSNHPENKLSTLSSQTIMSLLVDGAFNNFMRSASDGEAEAARGLLSAWVERQGAVAAANRLDLAMRYELAAGIAPAREIIENRKGAGASRNQLQNAIRFIAIFAPVGGRQDLEPLLDLSVVSLPEMTRGPVLFELPPRSAPVPAQELMVNDLALLALIQVCGLELRDFGVNSQQKMELQRRYNSGAPIFSSEKDRRAALEKWRSWRLSHSSQFLPVPEDASHGRAI